MATTINYKLNLTLNWRNFKSKLSILKIYICTYKSTNKYEVLLAGAKIHFILVFALLSKL